MKIVNPDKLSFVTIPISLHLKETNMCLYTGTAFLYKYDEKIYLITNWHLVTGLSPNTGKPISAHGGIPDQMHISFLTSKTQLVYCGVPIDLYAENISEWLIHPVYKENVDVIAIEIEFEDNFPGIIKLLNDVKFDNYNPEVGDDVFVLGYPYAISGGGNFPIWKKGSIASEPEIDYDGLPKFFIDTASKSGMSGSPVIFRRIGIHNAFGNKLTSDAQFGEIRNFVGVYSGRIVGESDFDAQLGVVWKKEVIEEIIKGNVKESRNFA